MSHIESLLKQFVLLSTICFLTASAASAATDNSRLASGVVNTTTVAAKAKLKRAPRKPRKAEVEEFTNSFSMPFLPAIPVSR